MSINETTGTFEGPYTKLHIHFTFADTCVPMEGTNACIRLSSKVRNMRLATRDVSKRTAVASILTLTLYA